MKRRLAGKAFILYGERLLLIKRPETAVQSPGIWEVPGGRVEAGESPIDALKREVKEETGLTITVHFPFANRTFTRVDGEIVDLIIYYCTTTQENVTLSAEHTQYQWVALPDAPKTINPFYAVEIQRLQKMHVGGILK